MPACGVFGCCPRALHQIVFGSQRKNCYLCPVLPISRTPYMSVFSMTGFGRLRFPTYVFPLGSDLQTCRPWFWFMKIFTVAKRVKWISARMTNNSLIPPMESILPRRLQVRLIIFQEVFLLSTSTPYSSILSYSPLRPDSWFFLSFYLLNYICD